MDVNDIFKKYEERIGQLEGQNIRTEAVMAEQINQAREQAQATLHQLGDALALLQDLAGSLKNTNAQRELRNKITAFMQQYGGEPVETEEQPEQSEDDSGE